MGVVVGRYIDILTIIINFPYSICIGSFFGSSIPTSLFILKMFFLSCLCYFCTIINPRRACTARVTVVVSCVCACLYVCLSAHAILAVHN